MSLLPHGAPRVAVVPVGGPSETAVRCAGDTLERELGVASTVFESQSTPDPEHDGGPVEADNLFARTADPVGEDFDLAIGVTDVPVRTADQFGLFGVTNRGGRLAVVSTDRVLDGESFDDEARRRLAKLCLYAVGGLFGFETHDGCVMQSANMLAELDDRPATFCDDCTRRLADPDTAPEPPKWRVVTTELEEFRTARRWAEGDVRLAEYPIIALGWLVVTLERVGSALTSVTDLSVPRSVRAFVHESYRTIRFWVLVLTYFATFVLVVAGGFRGYEAVTGSAPSDVVTWGVAILGLPVALVVHLVVRGIAAGLFVGAAEGTREGLRAEE
ncbi:MULTISPECIES: hypothetical protein [Halorussus]|uniref:hypothetical protein n=1 Tax=Halorussus TaxID=1070314 RepID=UPI00209F5222|nr:hypothetical protein [Halorussus vallis]USZ76406.1 hypothetical protein NGM07_03540 [Halorussus vallis]